MRPLFNPDDSRSNITVEDYENLGPYDIVVITAHGSARSPDEAAGNVANPDAVGPVISAGQRVTHDNALQYLADGAAIVGGHFDVTPAFVA